MRKIGFLIVLGLLSFSAMSQEYNVSDSGGVDPRIVEVFGDQLESLVLNDRDRIDFLKTLLDRRVQIIVEPYSSTEDYVKLSTVAINNKYNPNLVADTLFIKEKFNVLKYQIPFYSLSTKYYRVDNTDFVVKVLSMSLKE